MDDIDLTEGQPLAASEEEALQMPSQLVRHYKGGIYRVVATGHYCPDGKVPFEDLPSNKFVDAIHSETLRPVEVRLVEGEGLWALAVEAHEGGIEEVTIYEHLWPNPHRFWVRPTSLFDSLTAEGKPRFAAIRGETLVDREEILRIVNEEANRLWHDYLTLKDKPHLDGVALRVHERHDQTMRLWHRIADGVWPD